MNEAQKRDDLILVLKYIKEEALIGSIGRLEYTPISMYQDDLITYEREVAILHYLTAIGVIKYHEYDPSDTDGEFHAVVEWISEDKYQKELAKIGLVDKGYAIVAISKDNGSIQPLNHRSYDRQKATLYFMGKEIKIVRQVNKVEGTGRHEPPQATAMRLLFQTPQTMKAAVEMRRIPGVSKSKYENEKEIRKKIINHLAEINKKVASETGIADLIKYGRNDYYINPVYL